MPGAIKVQTPYRYRCHDCQHLDACTLRCADDLALRIEMEGPDTVAAVFMEPLQNTGGAFAPPEGYWARIREICDRYGVLLVSDEVICAFGRLGHMFGSDRYGYQPDIDHVRQGRHVGLRAARRRDGLATASPSRSSTTRTRSCTARPSAPIRCRCAVANANLDILEREDLCGHVLANEARFTELLDGLRDIPLVGDVRGDGYFRAIELVSDQATKGAFTADEAEWLLRGYLSPRLYEAGLICRADDRAEPVITLSPPLIAGEEELSFIADTVADRADAPRPSSSRHGRQLTCAARSTTTRSPTTTCPRAPTTPCRCRGRWRSATTTTTPSRAWC